MFIFTLFTVDLKLLIYTQKKSLYSLYSNNIELINVNCVSEQEMQPFLGKDWRYKKHCFSLTWTLIIHSRKILQKQVLQNIPQVTQNAWWYDIKLVHRPSWHPMKTLFHKLSVKKMNLKIHRKTPVMQYFSTITLKRGIDYRCFPVKVSKFKNSCFTEHFLVVASVTMNSWNNPRRRIGYDLKLVIR